MTRLELMLAAIRGEALDRLPWAPRIDLWHRANCRAGTLPARFKDASLFDIADELDIGFHAVIPDFRDLRGPADDAARPLGIYNLACMPCRSIFENVDMSVTQEGDLTITLYRTPFGDIRTTSLYDEDMKRSGATITHVCEHGFKTAGDYRALAHIFENIRVEPNYDGYRAFAEKVGDRGVAVAFLSLAGSPMHLIQRELMPLETFFYEMHDRPGELAALETAIGSWWERMLAVAADAPADVFLLGANYDASVTYPPFFRDSIMPWLRKFADILHGRGKYLLTHTDGENTGLLDHFISAGFDVADSICPAPMTKLSMKQVRDVFSGRITIMGGIPSVTLLRSSLSDKDFPSFLDGFFEEIGDGSRMILGISDTTPPQADFNRILEITRRAREFGPVPALRTLSDRGR